MGGPEDAAAEAYFTPPEPFKREIKYEVLKLDDLHKFLSPEEGGDLENIIHRVQEGRRAEGKKPCNSYVVVNEDEPYAEIVWGLIHAAEDARSLGTTALPFFWRIEKLVKSFPYLAE